MHKYIVSMAVDGRIDVEVEAENIHDAWEAADMAFCDADLSEMEVVGSTPVNISSAETGELLEDYNG